MDLVAQVDAKSQWDDMNWGLPRTPVAPFGAWCGSISPNHGLAPMATCRRPFGTKVACLSPVVALR